MASSPARVRTATPLQATTRKLAPQHFAFLRAVVCEGLDLELNAERYLSITHGMAAARAMGMILDRVTRFARLLGDRRWRLLRLEIPAQAGPVPIPPLYEWAEENGILGEWSEAELLDIYHAQVGQPDKAQQRRALRNRRLREARLALLRRVEGMAAVAPRPVDSLADWLTQELAEQLRQCGDLTLADLQRRIAQGGRWWKVLRAYGKGKAIALQEHVEMLVGPYEGHLSLPLGKLDSWQLSGEWRSNRGRPAPGLMLATNDAELIDRWVAARAGEEGSLNRREKTAEQYARQAERFLLFCVIERHKAMSDADHADCLAFIDFLGNIPDRWISRGNAPKLQAGWAPFRGQLQMASRRVAVDVVANLFAFAQEVGYLAGNPWASVSRRIGDAKVDDETFLESLAFTPAAWDVLTKALDMRPAGLSTERLRWLLAFGSMVGLRAAELIQAKRAHLRKAGHGWVIRVHGKGMRNRTVPVPTPAIEATRRYFLSRGLDFPSAAPEVPLVGSVVEHGRGVGYSALRESFTVFVRQALKNSRLPIEEREQCEKATLHWLRHTYATRSAEANIPEDITQANLGHSDPRTTRWYYRAQLQRRQAAMEAAFAPIRTTAE